ncbi:FMN-dependent dehydrogenase-domain-containing protein [Xylogone sp. PMI_703]|nr:FMN-dependent dehydrogenase-domain-containing protein [Xylogone sp. PMI_703]
MSGSLISLEELCKHNKPDDVWIVVQGKVYDVTEFALLHPGGSQVIYEHAASDATSAYLEVHAPSLITKSLDQSKHIGWIDPGTIKLLQSQPSNQSNPTVPQNSLSAKPPLDSVLNLFDFENIANQCLSKKIIAYVGGAANDCITHRNNCSIWARVSLRPRILRNVSNVSTRARILGHEFDLPLFISPFGMAKLTHPDGELSIARAVADSDITMCYSTYASFPFSETMSIMPPNYPLFFQLYVNKNRKKTEAMVREVVASGARALIVTVDLPVVGKREADERIASSTVVTSYNAEVSSNKTRDKKGHGWSRVTAKDIDPSFSWDDLPWLRSITNLPIVLKGIQTAADAKRAVDSGCEGIFVSNHGGRAVDTASASLLVLLEIRTYYPEVFQRLQVFVDGGIRRGTDILKALCLGATAVGVGRPVLYSNIYGQQGVSHLVSILKDELQTAMQQCGLTRLSDASPEYINASELDNLIFRSREKLRNQITDRAML